MKKTLLTVLTILTAGCVIPEPPPTTTTTTIPPQNEPAPVIVQLPGSNVIYAELKQVATITKCNFDGRNLDIAWTLSEPWIDEGDEYCDKVICFFDPRSGRAAYLEYSGIGWTAHNFNSIGDNLQNGHGDLNLVSRDTIYFFVCGWRNASQRSNLYKTEMP